MVDTKKTRGLGPAAHKLQEDTQTSFERVVPSMARNGAFVSFALNGGLAQKIQHGLKRKPVGWFLASIKGGDYAVVEVSSDANMLELQNVAASPADISGKVWVW